MAASNPSSKTAADEAIETVCARHLHQCLWLPESQSHGKLRITYSTTSNFHDTTLPTLLFCPPMFGSRWLAVDFDHTAKSQGVRIICPDRPSMGGSTPVSLGVRMQVWLEMVPALLKILNVNHVNVFAHSAGTTYALNTIYHLRDILDPDHPYVGFIAPWVHNEHSHATLMSMASNLPVGVFAGWNKVVQFINTKISPAVSWSGGVASASSGLLGSGDGSESTDQTSPGDRYGASEEVGKEIEKLEGKYFFAEDTTAGNEEAKLCLKKGPPGSWGICEDFEEYVRDFVAQEKDRVSSGSTGAKFKVQVFYAESDIMIGKGGQKYFEQCWKQDGVAEIIEFESKELPKTDHDSLLIDVKKGALGSIFQEVSRASKQ